jgi:hypothetical protein
VYFHNADWNHAYDYWHYSRPFVGGVVGGIGCLLFYVSIMVGSTKGVTPNVVTFDAVAFVLGFADKAFSSLITKLTQLLFGPVIRALRDLPTLAIQNEAHPGVFV